MDKLINYFDSILPLSKEEKGLMRDHLFIEGLKKGELYGQFGKTCQKIGFVLDGVLKVVKTKEDGDTFILYFTTENHFAVDIESFSNKTPSDEYMEALTTCKLVTISRVAYDLFEKMIPNFAKTVSLIKERALLEKYKMKSEMFVDDAQTKYNKMLKRHPSIIQRIGQNHIASFLGITQYTLSRIKAKR